MKFLRKPLSDVREGDRILCPSVAGYAVMTVHHVEDNRVYFMMDGYSIPQLYLHLHMKHNMDTAFVLYDDD